MDAIGRREQQRHECWSRWHDGVAGALREFIAGAVAAALRQRAAASGEHDARGAQLAGGGRNLETITSAACRDVEHACGRGDDCADPARFAEQRVEHVARPVAVGEQLAAGFLVERNADLAEEGDRVANRKRAQHAPHNRRRSAPEVVFADRDVGDVAAATAADQNLRARRACAVEDDDRERGIEAAREDCGREAGGAGADDGDVAG
jgi:hypothetical protein